MLIELFIVVSESALVVTPAERKRSPASVVLLWQIERNSQLENVSKSRIISKCLVRTGNRKCGGSNHFGGNRVRSGKCLEISAEIPVTPVVDPRASDDPCDAVPIELG